MRYLALLTGLLLTATLGFPPLDRPMEEDMNAKKVKELRREVERLHASGRCPRVTPQGFRRLKRRVQRSPDLPVEQHVMALARQDMARVWNGLDDEGRLKLIKAIAKQRERQKEAKS